MRGFRIALFLFLAHHCAKHSFQPGVIMGRLPLPDQLNVWILPHELVYLPFIFLHTLSTGNVGKLTARLQQAHQALKYAALQLLVFHSLLLRSAPDIWPA